MIRPDRYMVSAVVLTGLLHSSEALAAGADPATKHHEADSLPTTHQAVATPSTAKALAIDAGGVLVQFGGFVKVDFMQDFDPVGNADQFKVNSIPVPPDPDAELGGSTNVMARSTRFTLDARGSDDVAQVRAYVEGDFFGSGNSFRIRHAYGEWRGILGGQTWSTFQDVSARPFTLDYEGPDGEVFVRQAMIRYTGQASESMQWSIALEDPSSEIDVVGATTGSGRSEMPDIAGNVRFTDGSRHVQVSGVLRQLRFVSDGGVIDEKTAGYGLSVSGKSSIFGTDAIMGQFAFGSGIGHYIESFGGTGSDAVLTADGDLEALDGWAAVLGYTHQWNARVQSTLAASMAEVDNDPDQSATAVNSARSIHANVAYTPTPRFLAGAELMWGERENNDGSTGDATRLQLSLQYNFR